MKLSIESLKERKEEVNKLWTKAIEDRDMDAESTYRKLFDSYCNVIGDLINQSD